MVVIVAVVEVVGVDYLGLFSDVVVVVVFLLCKLGGWDRSKDFGLEPEMLRKISLMT
jgi:hypothetical protein